MGVGGWQWGQLWVCHGVGMGGVGRVVVVACDVEGGENEQMTDDR